MPTGTKERPTLFEIFKMRCNVTGTDRFFLYNLSHPNNKMFAEKQHARLLKKSSVLLSFVYPIHCCVLSQKSTSENIHLPVNPVGREPGVNKEEPGPLLSSVKNCFGSEARVVC